MCLIFGVFFLSFMLTMVWYESIHYIKWQLKLFVLSFLMFWRFGGLCLFFVYVYVKSVFSFRLCFLFWNQKKNQNTGKMITNLAHFVRCLVAVKCSNRRQPVLVVSNYADLLLGFLGQHTAHYELRRMVLVHQELI